MTEANPSAVPAGPPEPPCPRCGDPLEFTGLPDIAGPVRSHFFRCRRCGILRLDVDELPEGWG